MKSTEEKFSEEVLEFIRGEIEQSGGNEVLFIAHQNSEGQIVKAEVAARGNEESVNALLSWLEKGDVVLHNHPSGVLKPSKADLEIASFLGNNGFGFYIIDNEAAFYYGVSEPAQLAPNRQLNKELLLNSLEPGGVLSQIFDNYEYRESQVEMVSLIADAFNENKIAVAEAGTGVGKSLAYLLPSIEWASENKEKVVISTATINLQQQIYEKDLPLAMKVLGKEVETVLVKGRGNYLCLRRLEEALLEQSLFDEENEELSAIDKWASKTKEGCKSELSFLGSLKKWNKVCSEGDNCYGLRCKHREQCFVLKLKKKAAAADIIVANHHILFADLAYRNAGAGYNQSAVLPLFKKVVLDEAHNIESNATSFFSNSFNRFSVVKVLNRISQFNRGRYSGVVVELKKIDTIKERVATLPKATEELLQAFSIIDAYAAAIDFGDKKNNTLRFKAGELKPQQKQFIAYVGDFFAKANALYGDLAWIKKNMPDKNKESAGALELNVVLSRLDEILFVAKKFIDLGEDLDTVFWIKREADKSHPGDYFVTLNATPINIADKLQAALFEPIDTVVCASATLSINNDFKYFYSRSGLCFIEKERILAKSYPSPFNYKSNLLLQVPIDAYDQNNPRYNEYIARYCMRSLEITEGRGLILFTSFDMMNKIYDDVSPKLRELGINCYKQGDMDSSALLNSFKNDISSVLFATASFWEGIDAPGETLLMVIITKLPFSVPTDPLSKAREEACIARGGNPFMEISVPEAAMKLKQGFGRLIRSKNDRGVVAILDSRLVTKPYGQIFINSLPESNRSFVPSKELMAGIERFLY